LNVLLLSDTHGSHAILERIEKLHRERGVDLVCIGGDFTSDGAGHESLFGLIAGAGISCAFVSGNCESKKLCESAAAEYGFHCMDYRSELIAGLFVAGIAGFDFFSEKRAGRIADFAKASFDFESSHFNLLLTHQPPQPWSYRGREAGSVEVRHFMEGKPFNLVASGHFHERQPRLEEGPFGIPVLNPGRGGALVEIDPEAARFRIIS